MIKEKNERPLVTHYLFREKKELRGIIMADPQVLQVQFQTMRIQEDLVMLKSPVAIHLIVIIIIGFSISPEIVTIIHTVVTQHLDLDLTK